MNVYSALHFDPDYYTDMYSNGGTSSMPHSDGGLDHMSGHLHPPLDMGSGGSLYQVSADPSPSGSSGGHVGNGSGPSSTTSMPLPLPSMTSNSTSAPKKRKMTKEGDAPSKPEPKKRPQSCDVCRARKVKCVKDPGAGRCEGCVALDQRCEYTHERKKPGPANR
jgi:hypothetical protein